MYHGKVIYNPSGKAQEYNYWAANFYNGCSAKCDYCYNRKGITAKVLGGDTPTLKKSLVNEERAIDIFTGEMAINKGDLQKHGLFFNFVSDPCLPETIELNFKAIRICHKNKIPVKLLTKQTWWLGEKFIQDISLLPDNVAYGFTLTGHGELEPGAATNMERIEAMKKLHNAGFKTWASIEPIIDFKSSYEIIQMLSLSFSCDLFKIGLQSGKKYDLEQLERFITKLLWMTDMTPIYLKDSLLQQAGIRHEDLPANCVTRDFNLWKQTN
jgi:DNA repair photolyase